MISTTVLIPLSLMEYMWIKLPEDQFTIQANGDTYSEIWIDLLIEKLWIPDDIKTTVDNLFF